jgi:excisionase family DNA binding protein
VYISRPYLTAHQVAELLQLNIETVYALITREGLPATRVGRRWRFDESRVRRWFDERGHGPRRGRRFGPTGGWNSGHGGLSDILAVRGPLVQEE